jgi:hypothetical protein
LKGEEEAKNNSTIHDAHFVFVSVCFLGFKRNYMSTFLFLNPVFLGISKSAPRAGWGFSDFPLDKPNILYSIC